MGFLHDAVIYLAAAVFIVPLFKRLNLGSVLGYLAAGVLIGPDGLGLITDPHSVLHFAEFGVVLLLFLIGLELQPARLWDMRRTVFGLGAAQVLGTSALFALLGVGLGAPVGVALLIGAGLSLSSTAFALQLLAEKNQLTAPHGRVAFGILLFQDLAVIPLLALLPLMGDGPAGGDSAHVATWITALKTLGVLGTVWASRYLLRPLFRVIAALHMPELFTATALLVVVGTALGVSSVGLSMALGAFLAGVMLADSQYRHELEADIEPFKGLLLGLFFIAVGMSVNLPLVLGRPGTVAGLVVALVLVKALVLWVAGRSSGLSRSDSLQLALVISQGGEFAFVLFGLAVDFHVMDRETADLLIAVVSISMAVTPFLLLGYSKVRVWRGRSVGDRVFDVSPSEDTPVVIAGFGRVGQIISRVLRAKHIPFTALDIDPEHIDFIKTFGAKVFYGDASRLELLRAARTDKAQVFVLAIDNVEASLRTATAVREHFPHVTIVARARNRVHAYALMRLGVAHVLRETLFSSLEMTHAALGELGLTYSESRQAVERFRDHDEALMHTSFAHLDDVDRLRQINAAARAELESLFQQDAAESKSA